MKRFFAVVLGLAVCGLSNHALHAQEASSTSDGVYTAAQAQRGGALYHQDCASCHGAELDGAGETPALSGSDFAGNWIGQPMAALFDMIQMTMPADQPGKLTREQAADVVAFILSSNKFPPGKTELPADEESLKKIHIDPVPPKS